jgi:uncharacterized protein (TIGR00251 family)
VIIEKDGAIMVRIRAIPRASRSEILKEVDGSLRVRITSPPVDGAANAEIVKLFAKALSISRSSVEIVSGVASRTKRLQIVGVTATEFRKRLGF